jgi:hypothetical protein
VTTGGGCSHQRQPPTLEVLSSPVDVDVIVDMDVFLTGSVHVYL